MRSQKICTPQLKMQDPDLGLEKIIGMMKTIFMNYSERPLVPKRSKESYQNVLSSGSEPRTDNVRESTITLTCHHYKKSGHKKNDCKELMGKSDKPSNVENGTRKWYSYHHSSRHSNENWYQQQQSGKTWCTCYKSGTQSDDQCYHQRHGSRNFSSGGKSTKDETFVADNSVTNCDKCSCNRKVESKTTEDDEPNNTPPGIGFCFAMCHPPYLKKPAAFNSW